MKWLVYYVIVSFVAGALIALVIHRAKLREAYHRGCMHDPSQVAEYTDAQYYLWCDGRRGVPRGTTAAHFKRKVKS